LGNESKETREPARGQQRLAAYSRKASETKAHLVLIDETGLFLDPIIRRTWSLVGQTPVIDADGGHRDKVSVIGGVSVSPASSGWGFTSPRIQAGSSQQTKWCGTWVNC
jgi:hypothetical protein